MELFHVTDDFGFTVPFEDGNRISTHLKKPEGKPNLASIYASTGACLETFRQQIAKKPADLPNGFKFKVLNTMDKRKIYKIDSFPKILSNFDGTLEEKDFAYNDPTNYKKIPSTPFIPLEEQIADIDGDEIKVFIINGMGTGLGDGMVGLTALNIFYKKLKQKYKKVIIDIAQPMVIGDKNHQALYSQEPIINSLSYLPVTVEKLIGYDLLMDNSAMIIRENFPNNTMMDFFLENLGIDPKTVPASEKRIFIKKNERAETILGPCLKLLRQDPNKKLVMLHTSASTVVRSMPRDIIKRVIKQILDVDSNITVVTWEKMDDIKDDINKYLGGRKHRHVNLSFKNTAFDLYTYMISQMDALVTVDTSSYHIANSFDVPAVVIFQTIDPKLRIKDYPLVSAIEVTKDKALRGVHISQDQKHIQLMLQYWRDFDTKKIATELKSIMIKKRVWLADPKNYTPCPICDTKALLQPVDKLGENVLVECHNCGAEFAPNRTVADYNDMYKDEYQHYIQDEPADNVVKKYLTQSRFEQFIDVMQTLVTSDKKYLDYGCASGFLVAYAKGIGYDAYGVDISDVAIGFAKRKFGLGENVANSESIKNLPDNFPEQFDIISSIEVVEHLADPKAFAKDVYDKLKPGGVWFISTPNRDRIQFRAGVKNTTKHKGLETGDYPTEHLQRFRAKTHKILVESVGFEIIHQMTCRIATDTIYDISGEPPDISINIENNKQVMVPKDGIKQFMGNFYQPMLDGTDGLGNFLITIVRKPTN